MVLFCLQLKEQKRMCGDFGRAHIQQQNYYKRFDSNENRVGFGANVCRHTKSDYRNRAFMGHEVCVCARVCVYSNQTGYYIVDSVVHIHYIVIILMCLKSSNKIFGRKCQ